MKWFQPIECDNTVKKPLVCDYGNFEQHGYDEHSFKVGKRIANWDEEFYIKATDNKCNGAPDDALQNSYMLPIYSERLINELNRVDIQGIQYLPIKILNYHNELHNGYKIANFLNFVEAFDYEKSVYNKFPQDFPNPNVRGQIAGVMKFVLKKEMLCGLDIIRLKEYKRRFFVSEIFVDVFEKNNFTGYSFKEVDLV